MHEADLTEDEAFDIGDALARLLLLVEMARDSADDADRGDFTSIVGALEDVGTTLADLGIVEPDERFNRMHIIAIRRDEDEDDEDEEER